MDALHLSYSQVFEQIPYRVLVLMQHDKLRVCYGDKLTEVTPAQMGIIFDET